MQEKKILFCALILFTAGSNNSAFAMRALWKAANSMGYTAIQGAAAAVGLTTAQQETVQNSQSIQTSQNSSAATELGVNQEAAQPSSSTQFPQVATQRTPDYRFVENITQPHSHYRPRNIPLYDPIKKAVFVQYPNGQAYWESATLNSADEGLSFTTGRNKTYYYSGPIEKYVLAPGVSAKELFNYRLWQAAGSPRKNGRGSASQDAEIEAWVKERYRDNGSIIYDQQKSSFILYGEEYQLVTPNSISGPVFHNNTITTEQFPITIHGENVFAQTPFGIMPLTHIAPCVAIHRILASQTR